MVKIIERCNKLEANAPTWEIYLNGKLMQTVHQEQFLSAVVRYYKSSK